MEPDQVFEISYEICNKVGGIYTVLKSKAINMVEHYGDRYCAIGFFDAEKSPVEFDSKEIPGSMKDIFSEMEKTGIKCYFGTWLISGKPKTILIDPSGFTGERDRIKTDLWKYFQVDSIKADYMFDEPVVWSTACGMLVEKLSAKFYKNTVAHFHEWLTGAGLLYLKMEKSRVGTVFTTHATMLGRTIAGSDFDLYKLVNEGIQRNEIASLDLARRYGVLAKHTMEVACANNADIFSTVSDITGKEAQYILGRKPDIILPNGITVERHITLDDLVIMRRDYRKHTQEFLKAYFSRYYDIDYDHIRTMFISGRYEFRNKGIDIFIESLGRLNDRLKMDKVDKVIIAFIFVPSKIKGERIDVLRDISLYREMEDCIEGKLPVIKDKILNSLARGVIPQNTYDLFDEDFIQTCRNMLVHFTEKKRQNPKATPPLIAFDLDYWEQDDPILRALIRNGLFNREEDNVKVIFYPAYLNPGDRLIGLSYEHAMMTFDLGVFPSYYEPWGYTPLEAAAHGVLSITTDLSGFGKFIEQRGDGVSVIKRDNREDREVIHDLTDRMYNIMMFSREDRVKHRMRAKELASLADWSIMVKNYINAHESALEKINR